MQIFAAIFTRPPACLEVENPDDFKGKLAMDLGAGSGILSFFAVQVGDPGHFTTAAREVRSICRSCSVPLGYSNIINQHQPTINPYHHQPHVVEPHSLPGRCGEGVCSRGRQTAGGMRVMCQSEYACSVGIAQKDHVRCLFFFICIVSKFSLTKHISKYSPFVRRCSMHQQKFGTRNCHHKMDSLREASSMGEVVRTLADANAFLTKKIEAKQGPGCNESNNQQPTTR